MDSQPKNVVGPMSGKIWRNKILPEMFPHCIKKDWNNFKTVRSRQWSSLDVQVEGEGKRIGHPHGSLALFSLYSSQRVKGYALSPMGLGIHTSLWFKPDNVHNQGGLPVGVGLEVVSSKRTQVPLALLDIRQLCSPLIPTSLTSSLPAFC